MEELKVVRFDSSLDTPTLRMVTTRKIKSALGKNGISYFEKIKIIQDVILEYKKSVYGLGKQTSR